MGLLLLAILARSLWLPVIGKVLMHDDGPAKADCAVVLGGDFYGRRVERAAELVRGGYVPLVLVSGSPAVYGMRESDLEIAFMERQGCPREWFEALHIDPLSTRDEAYGVLAELRRRNAHSFLLVTSDYHSARAARIFRAVARELSYTPQMRMVTAPDQEFRLDTWWRSREGQKTVLLEWTKSAAAAIGL